MSIKNEQDNKMITVLRRKQVYTFVLTDDETKMDLASLKIALEKKIDESDALEIIESNFEVNK